MKKIWAKITCLNCGHEIVKVVDTFINPNVEKEVKHKILNDEFFYETCPKCHTQVKSLYPCIYKDSQHNLLLFMKQPILIDEPLYHHRLVKKADDFKEMIMIYDAELEDRAVCVLKHRLAKKLNTKAIRFISVDHEYVFFNVDGQIKAVQYSDYLLVKENLPLEQLGKMFEFCIDNNA